MMEMFKGQISFNDIKNMTYKEALQLRDVRYKRLMKEREEMERERKEMEAKNKRR